MASFKCESQPDETNSITVNNLIHKKNSEICLTQNILLYFLKNHLNNKLCSQNKYSKTEPIYLLCKTLLFN